MTVSYEKLWKAMAEQNLTKTELTHKAGISTHTMAKLGRGEDVRLKTLEKLCVALGCGWNDLVEFIPDSQNTEKVQ